METHVKHDAFMQSGRTHGCVTEIQGPGSDCTAATTAFVFGCQLPLTGVTVRNVRQQRAAGLAANVANLAARGGGGEGSTTPCAKSGSPVH